MSSIYSKINLLIWAAIALNASAFAQGSTGGGSTSTITDKFGRLGINTVTTAVPFLIISPESRAGGMGDVGVATSADANSIHWNPAKMVFNEKDMGFSLSYTPWLSQLVPDINLSYLAGYKKLNKNSAIASSLRYFSLGNIQFTDENGTNTIQFKPNEFAFDVSYSILFSKKFSGGIALRYVNSNLTGAQNIGSIASKPAQAVAADVSVYYQSSKFDLGEKKGEFAFGTCISNIGNRVAYTQTTRRDFIPINLRLGPRFTIDFDKYNKLSIALDFNKYMVPTPPIYDAQQNIIAGKDPNRAVANGMFGSFSDAPGAVLTDQNGDIIYLDNGMAEVQKGSIFKEELSEITIGFGAEYWYNNLFAVRTGYFYENPNKGNRQYTTVGASLKYNVFAIDFAYLIPTYFNSENIVRNSPLQNTLRFTLKFDFVQFVDQQNQSPE